MFHISSLFLSLNFPSFFCLDTKKRSKKKSSMTQGAKVCCPFRALWYSGIVINPRALLWADKFCPFRAQIRKHGIIAKKGWKIVFRPEGATYISPTATPWVIMEWREKTRALKGQHNIRYSVINKTRLIPSRGLVLTKDERIKFSSVSQFANFCVQVFCN